jgi:vitamin B12 transporter
VRKLFLFLLITVANQSLAQINLDTIVIRENRIQMPFSSQNRDIRIIGKKEIAALPVRTVSDLLGYTAGIDLRRRGPVGTQADISIDGSNFDQVLVLVNGIKMSDPQTGHHMLNLPIPLSAIDHIEVLRGPAASIYGVNALAGAINIITKTPESNSVSVEMYAGSSFQSDSSNGDTYYNIGTQAAVSLVGKTNNQLITASHDRGNGTRYNTGFNTSRIYYKLQQTINTKNKLDIEGAYINNDFGGNGFYAAPYDVNSTERVQTAYGSIRQTYSPNEKLTIRPGIGVRYNADDYIFIKQDPDYYKNHHETNVITGEVQSTYKIKNGFLASGIEYRKEAIHSNNLGERNRDNTGFYAEYRQFIKQSFSTTIGIYGNYNSDFGWNLYPAINAGLIISDNWKIYANAGTGQRLPTFTDLYYDGPSNIGNAELKPENATFSEIGIRYKKNIISAHSALFYRSVNNMIDYVRSSNSAPWQPMNYQTVNTTGLTTDLLIDFNNALHWDEDHPFNLHVSYTYLDMSIKLPGTSLSKYAIDALRHQFIAGFTIPISKKIVLHANERYLYRINGNDYTLIDARLVYKRNQLSITADISNILNTQYKEIGAIPMPGRWYSLGARYDIPWK